MDNPIITAELQEIENKLKLYSKSNVVSLQTQVYLLKAHLEILKALKLMEI